MNLLHAHDKDLRAQGARGFFSSVVLALVTSAVAVSMAVTPAHLTASSSHPDRSAGKVAVLERQTADQAREIQELKALFLATNDESASPRSVDQTPLVVGDNDASGDGTRVERQTESRTLVIQPRERPAPPQATAVELPTQAVDNTVKQTTNLVKDTLDTLTDATRQATVLSHREDR